MLKIPTSRKRKKPDEKLNLVPIMDSVFIFIFFLLMSASFLKIYEIGSPIPIVSDKEPPKKEKDPLALTLTADTNELVLSQGVPSRQIHKFVRQPDGEFNFEELHVMLINLKKQHLDEDTIIFEPTGELTYEEIVKILDAVRVLHKTDEAIFKTNKEGIDEKLKDLFTKIIFSNLMS
ncbi:MAG TPA: biopolymer transporter ExbD [Bacteriovoracaceae bacterium]|nr:biopolymer transporter ExbD [Bacteriovoracaceae bacterium]